VEVDGEMSAAIHQGDWVEVLKTIEDESVDCIVTSPPYWRQRDYKIAGQLGLERHPEEYVSRLVCGFREARRVLKSTGTLWLNLGDKWASGGNGGGGKWMVERGHAWDHAKGAKGWRKPPEGYKDKDLVGIPWMTAFALRNDGWYLRQDIIWSKPNPMPESVTDRCTKSHEYIFLLTKSARYWYDRHAILEPFADSTPARMTRGNGGTSAPGQTAHSGVCGPRLPGTYKGSLPGRNGGPGQDRRSKNDRSEIRTRIDLNENWDSAEANGTLGAGANKRSVWNVATSPFPEAHFATFPPEIPEICIKAGCPENGTVLDPFCGAGTTGMVAKRLMRNFIGIELKPQYVEMARRRIENDAPLFNVQPETTEAACAD
jgi:DNA modification methylase